MRRFLLLFALLPINSAFAQTDIQAELLKDYLTYDDRCCGGSGDENSTWEACGARHYVGFLLNQNGWCYGHETDAGYQMRWHECENGSNHFAKP